MKKNEMFKLLNEHVEEMRAEGIVVRTYVPRSLEDEMKYDIAMMIMDRYNAMEMEILLARGGEL
jgi:hypothetical protein